MDTNLLRSVKDALPHMSLDETRAAVKELSPDALRRLADALDADVQPAEEDSGKQILGVEQSDLIDAVVSSVTGEMLVEIQVDGMWTAKHTADVLAGIIPLPPRTMYQLVIHANALKGNDRLRQHIEGNTAEITACLRNVGQIAAGEYFTVCLTDAGIKQYGRRHGNGDKFARDPPDDLSFTEVQQVVCGYRYAAALLTSGELRFWGSSRDDVGEIPDFGGQRVVSLGNCRSVNTTGHAAVVLEDGTVRCWGWNSSGQCDVPPLPAGCRAVQVTGGAEHTVALLDDGSLQIWGNREDDNPDGSDDYELRKETTSEGHSRGTRLIERLIFSRGRRAVFVDSAKYHNIALLDDGSFVCFGGEYTRRASGSLKNAAAGRSAVAVSAGNKNYIVLLEDGEVITAGHAERDFRKLADKLATSHVVGIAGGEWHCAVLLDDDEVIGWGDNGHGEYPDVRAARQYDSDGCSD